MATADVVATVDERLHSYACESERHTHRTATDTEIERHTHTHTDMHTVETIETRTDRDGHKDNRTDTLTPIHRDTVTHLETLTSNRHSQTGGQCWRRQSVAVGRGQLG